jgi:hypothetical protein
LDDVGIATVYLARPPLPAILAPRAVAWSGQAVLRIVLGLLTVVLGAGMALVLLRGRGGHAAALRADHRRIGQLLQGAALAGRR